MGKHDTLLSQQRQTQGKYTTKLQQTKTAEQQQLREAMEAGPEEVLDILEQEEEERRLQEVIDNSSSTTFPPIRHLSDPGNETSLTTSAAPALPGTTAEANNYEELLSKFTTPPNPSGIATGLAVAGALWGTKRAISRCFSTKYPQPSAGAADGNPAQRALKTAINNGDAARVHHLLTKGHTGAADIPDPNRSLTATPNGEFALTTAILKGHLPIVKELVEARASVNAIDGQRTMSQKDGQSYGVTPLGLAYHHAQTVRGHANVEIFNYLISRPGIDSTNGLVPLIAEPNQQVKTKLEHHQQTGHAASCIPCL